MVIIMLWAGAAVHWVTVQGFWCFMKNERYRPIHIKANMYLLVTKTKDRNSHLWVLLISNYTGLWYLSWQNPCLYESIYVHIVDIAINCLMALRFGALRQFTHLPLHLLEATLSWVKSTRILIISDICREKPLTWKIQNNWHIQRNYQD